MIVENYRDFFVVSSLVIFVALFLYNTMFSRRYKSKVFLNSKAEMNFLMQLHRTMPSDYIVMCKVRLADIVTPTNSKNIRLFRLVSSKHVDFVICERSTSKIVMCIELDDASHFSPSAKKRDREKDMALKSAQVNVVRVRASRTYSNAVINSITSELHNNANHRVEWQERSKIKG